MARFVADAQHRQHVPRIKRRRDLEKRQRNIILSCNDAEQEIGGNGGDGGQFFGEDGAHGAFFIQRQFQHDRENGVPFVLWRVVCCNQRA